MKLKSLNPEISGSKFEAFKGSELQKSFKIMGGQCNDTHRNGDTHSTDSLDTLTMDPKYFQTLTDGSFGDVFPWICPVGAGEGMGPTV